jgi:hypothetical protein
MWQRSGVGDTRQSDHRKAKRTNGCADAGHFLQGHGDSFPSV